jgi:hypothetical protein
MGSRREIETGPPKLKKINPLSFNVLKVSVSEVKLLLLQAGELIDFDMSRIIYFQQNRFTNGVQIGSITRWPSFPARKISGTHFC